MSSYFQEAVSDSQDTAREFKEQIVEQLLDNKSASDDLLNDYGSGDSYHHERHVDRSYSLIESAELIDELDNWEETDSGLWEGMKSLREQIGAMAAFTYGNCVMSQFQKLITDINDDTELCNLAEEYNADPEDCDECDGTGTITLDDEESTEQECDECHGEGTKEQRSKEDIKKDVEARLDKVIDKWEGSWR